MAKLKICRHLPRLENLGKIRIECKEKCLERDDGGQPVGRRNKRELKVLSGFKRKKKHDQRSFHRLNNDIRIAGGCLNVTYEVQQTRL